MVQRGGLKRILIFLLILLCFSCPHKKAMARPASWPYEDEESPVGLCPSQTDWISPSPSCPAQPNLDQPTLSWLRFRSFIEVQHAEASWILVCSMTLAKVS